MLGILYALITMLAWGTWLDPSQNVPFKNQQNRMFYVASANLLLAFLIAGERHRTHAPPPRQRIKPLSI